MYKASQKCFHEAELKKKNRQRTHCLTYSQTAWKEDLDPGKMEAGRRARATGDKVQELLQT